MYKKVSDSKDHAILFIYLRFFFGSKDNTKKKLCRLDCKSAWKEGFKKGCSQMDIEYMIVDIMKNFRLSGYNLPPAG